MTVQNDLDRAIGAWFSGGATTTPPPEPLARAIESTRRVRPRPAFAAQLGSNWVGAGPASGIRGGIASLRPAFVVALVALLALALVGGALLAGGRLIAPQLIPHRYLNELDPAPNLPSPMSHPALVTLVDGRVLVLGNGDDSQGSRALVYEPATGASVIAGPMVSGASSVVSEALRLPDGRVLVIGVEVVQVFDPTTLQFEAVGPMATTPRWGAAGAMLPDGRVLVTGGSPLNGDGAPLSSAELLDPDTLTFSATGSMGVARVGHSMVTLPDGRVFVTPGASRNAEVYDPSTGTFGPAGTASGPIDGIPIALSDGRVVILESTGFQTQGHVDVWDPVSRTFSTGGDLPAAVSQATLLDDGRIFMAGGRYESWSGLYDPATRTSIETRPTLAWRPSLTRLTDGRVLIVGGLVDGKVRPGPGGGGEMAPAVPTVEFFR